MEILSKRALLGVLGFLMLPLMANAQDMEDLRSRMSSAAAMTKVDMNEALRQYLEIRVQYAGPEVDYSLGRAYQRLNQCREAQHYYSQVMAAYDLPDDNAIYQRAVNAYDEISSCESWQKVKVSCEVPAGGHVEIDGEMLGGCWDRPFSMKDGEHVFKLVSPDGGEIEKKLTAKSGEADAEISLAFPVKEVTVEKVIKEERHFEYKERFHPALYWGLIAGGAAVVAVGGFMSGYAGAATVSEQRYADLSLFLTDKEDYRKKAKSARDDVKVRNAVMYSLIGVGSAMAVTGAVLAIVSHMSGKERVEISDGVNAYVSPMEGGVSMGVGMTF